MPRKPREYLLRHAEQTLNNLERAIDRLKLMSDMYGTSHESHQTFVDIIALRIIEIKDDLEKFRDNFM